MKTLIIIFLTIFLTACSSMDMQYEADLDVDNKPVHYTYHETAKIRGLAWTCGFTVFFYGGACWFYLGEPYGATEEVKEHALKNLQERYHLATLQIRYESIIRKSWDPVPTQSVLLRSDPSSTSPLPTEVRNPTSTDK